MAIETGPSIAPAITSTPVGGEISAGVGNLSSFSSIPRISEFSSFTPDSPVSSIQGFYAMEGAGTGINEGPVSSFDLSSYQTIIQAPEVTLTEKSGLEPSPFPADPLTYNPRTFEVEDLSFVNKEPNLPGLADIEFVGLSNQSAQVEIPTGIEQSLADINLDPDVSPEIDQTVSPENSTGNGILYSEIQDNAVETINSSTLNESGDEVISHQVDEVTEGIQELDLTDNQLKEVQEKVFEGVAVVEGNRAIENETGFQPLVVVEEANDERSVVGEPEAKSSEQVQMENAIDALLAARVPVSEIEKLLQSVAREKGLSIVRSEKSEEEVDEEEDLTELEIRELQEVLMGAKASPVHKSEADSLNKGFQQVQARIQRIFTRRAERAARNRMDALKDAAKQTFEHKEKDPSGQAPEVSGAEIVSQVVAPKEKVNSPVNPDEAEEGWALTLTRVASRQFQNPEQAEEYFRKLVFEEIQPVEFADAPNPPVSTEEYLLAISKRRSPQTVVDALKSQISTLQKAA